MLIQIKDLAQHIEQLKCNIYFVLIALRNIFTPSKHRNILKSENDAKIREVVTFYARK